MAVVERKKILENPFFFLSFILPSTTLFVFIIPKKKYNRKLYSEELEEKRHIIFLKTK